MSINYLTRELNLNPNKIFNLHRFQVQDQKDRLRDEYKREQEEKRLEEDLYDFTKPPCLAEIFGYNLSPRELKIGNLKSWINDFAEML